MKNLKIEATEQTLEIDFNFADEKLVISGESYPENSLDFFRPLQEWIKEYFAEKDKATVVFEIEYLNSSSYKSVYDFIMLLDDIRDEGKTIDVTWVYPDDDEDLLETGEDLTEDSELEVKFKAVE